MATTSKKSGIKAIAYNGTRGTLVTTGALDANAWYQVAAKAATGSALEPLLVTHLFKTPDAAETAITLVAGDEVYPMTLSQICKTDAEYSGEEGTIDVTDDCDGPFNSMIPDGFTTLSGTLNGFTRYNDATGEIVTAVEEVFGRFFDIVTDDGAGTYSVTPKENNQTYLFLLLNKDAALDQVQNYLISPAIFTSLSTGAPLKDAQKRDIAWTKGEGRSSFYKRTVKADDVL
jgi:hypothetical protein